MNHGLCSACKGVAGTDCDKTCPFNSDEAPPKLDDRSDAKGPEPECVTTGVMADGTLLAFIGLERTGGVMVYDISNPAAATFQDFLNVRNWRVGETPDNDEVAKNLNDGPESMVFVSAADSPIGKELLLVATPLAGRLTAYAISSASTARGNDGSCKDTPTCPYISAANGGSGVIRDFMDICNWCSTCTDAQKEAFGCSSRYSFEVVAAGTLEDFAGTAGAEKIDAIKTSVAAAAGAGVSKADVTVTVTAGSVIIKISIKADSAGELVEISNKVDPLLQTAGNATSLLGGQVTVESVSYKPPTEASPPPAPAMPPLKSDDGIPMWGLIVIIVFGAAFVFVCLVLMVVVRKEKKGKPIFVPMEKVHPGNTKG